MKRPDVSLPSDFGYAKYPELLEWIEREYPQVDSSQTMKRFIEAAPDFKRDTAKCWTAKFKRVVRTGMDNGWKGIAVKKPMMSAAWLEAISHSQAIGYPKPPEQGMKLEDFSKAIKQWENRPRQIQNVINFGDLTRAIK